MFLGYSAIEYEKIIGGVMKFLLSLVIFSLSLNCFALDIFSSTSPLPQELQLRVIELIKKSEYTSCFDYQSLKEVRTTFERDEVDQGVTDIYYTTYISGNYYLEDGSSKRLELIITSKRSDIDNPRFDPYQIELVNPDLSEFCQ